MSEFSHLDKLEAEAIYIIREVAAECEKPVMLYSIGKDSSVMLHLAMKAFYPEKPPFPFLHVNTTWKFKEMIEFRDKTAKDLGIEMLEYINEDGVKQGINPFDHGAAYTDIMKTQALKQALNKCEADIAGVAAESDTGILLNKILKAVQKSEFSPSEMNLMPGIRKTSALRCGNYTIRRSTKGRAFAYSQSPTGQKKTSGSTSNGKIFRSCLFTLRQKDQL